jgi:hypothetical protein
LARLNSSLNLERDRERDPALQALLFFIARLAESLSGVYMPDYIGPQDEEMIGKKLRAQWQTDWRTDLFKFRAFKFAVKKLLDALEEPRDMQPGFKRLMERFEKRPPGSPEPKFPNPNRSPEALGGHQFERLWRRSESTDNNEEILKGIRDNIQDKYLRDVLEHEFLKLPKARKALELKANTKKPKS